MTFRNLFTPEKRVFSRSGETITQLIIPIPLALFVLFIFFFTLWIVPATAETQTQRIPTAPNQLIASAQTLTTTWTDLGGELNASMDNGVCLFTTMTITDSLNVRFRLLGKIAQAGTNEYTLPIETVGASSVVVEDQYKELNVDASQDTVLCWDTLNGIPWIQFQVQAGTAGATPGRIDTAHATMGY